MSAINSATTIGLVQEPSVSTMEGVEYAGDAAASIVSTDAPAQAARYPSHGAGYDHAGDVRASLTLAHADVARLSALIASGNHSQAEVKQLRSKFARRIDDLEMITKALKFVEASASSTITGVKVSKVVPRGLPIFQWEGQVSVPTAPVFVDINTCIMNFTDVMNCHGLDLDENYLRVLPPLLAGTIRLWFQDFVHKFSQVYQQDPTWLQFATALQERYGLNAKEERNHCAQQLNEISMGAAESLENFIDRFNSLRRRAVDQVLPSSILADKFLLGLPTHTAKCVSLAMMNLPLYQREDVDVLANLARNAFNSKVLGTGHANGVTTMLSAPRAPKRNAMVIDANDAIHASSNRSRHAANNDRARSFAPVAVSAADVSPVTNTDLPRAPVAAKYCTFHKSSAHNTSDCRAAAAAASGNGPTHRVRVNHRKCYICHAVGWTPNHRCNTAQRSTPISDPQGKEFGGMSMEVDSTHDVKVDNATNTTSSSSFESSSSSASASSSAVLTTQAELAAAYNAGVADATADIGQMQISDDPDAMIALQAQQCKYHNIYSVPPANKSNMIIVPIVIENIKTYAILDTGATFSIISPAFAAVLGDSIKLQPSNGTISLGHPDSKYKSLNKTLLSIFYNKKSLKHTFEVFQFYTNHNNRNIPIIIGLDLNYKLNIGITGLALTHFDLETSNPFPDTPVDPASLVPNNSPYGTATERQLMETTLEPFLKDNNNIDIKNTYCTLPGAIIRLDTKPGCIAYKKQYPMPYAFRDAVNAQIQTWLDEGVIEKATSHTGFNSPLIVVGKKNAAGVMSYDKIRLVADVRNLNSILTITDSQSLPIIAEIHERIGRAKIHTLIDIRACFNSFLVEPEHRHKLAFTNIFTNRQYVFRRMCFGITFVGNLVQRVLQELFSDLDYIQVYVDDLTISTSGTLEHHAECVAEVLRRLTKHNLMISTEKMVLAQSSIHILGWSIVNGALVPDYRKVNTASEFNIPHTAKQLQSYLGYMNYFRASIPMYAHISSKLDKLRNVADLPSVWREEHTIAFNQLKTALAAAPLIHPIDYKHPIHVATDASNTAISGVLYMQVGNTRKYVAMASRGLNSVEQCYSTTRRELLGVVYCFQRFNKWLVNKHFTLHTDHRSLIYMHSQEIPNHLLLTYYEVLFGLSYTVIHIPGILNVVADAGSRLFTEGYNLVGGIIVDEDKSSFIISKKKNNKKRSIENTSEGDQSQVPVTQTHRKKVKPNKKKLIPQLNISSSFYKKAMRDNRNEHLHALNKDSTPTTENPDTSLEKINTGYKTPLAFGALQYADYITPPPKERDDIINRAHLLGHFGIKAVEDTIHNDYEMHWVNMREDIKRIVSNCDACSHFNIGKVGYHPYKSVEADLPLDCWSMDLGTFNVTSSSGNNYMLILVDYFSRFTVLRAIPDKSSVTIARELLNVFCLFSFPKVLTSDNGSEFVNEIVSQLILMSGIDRRLSLPYTPQGNSVCERFVGIAKSAIIKQLNGKHADWDLYLNPVQLAMNIKYSKLHKSRPYSIVFNRQPNDFKDYSNVEPSPAMINADTKKINDRLTFAQEVVIPHIASLIRETQEKDHKKFGKNHRVLTEMYPIGSKVMIKNVHRKTKLDESYSGPFYIKGYTKNKSYILMDPAQNLLSRDVPTQQIKLIDANAASQNEVKDQHYEVQAIVAHRGVPTNYEYLVHWLGYNDPADRTWQKESDFDSKLHIELYWKRRNNNGNTKDAPSADTVNNTIRKRANRNKHSNKNAHIIKRSQRLLAKQQQ